MNREQAWELLCEFTKSDGLRRHALAVEACVTAYARKFGQDEAKWSLTALLHDFDWEIHPTLPDHPMKGEPILAERGVDPEIRRAILSHADFSGVPRESLLEKTLFACDELAGFLTACSYVKPGRSIHEVDAKSVRKKLKDKAFARSVNRDDITNGAAELNVDLDRHIAFCIEAMQQRAAELGLAGVSPMPNCQSPARSVPGVTGPGRSELSCISSTVYDILRHCRAWDGSVAECSCGDREAGMIRKSFGIVLLLVGVSQFASAGVFTTPELDPATGVSALVLLSGALLILRARRRK